jgi:hypothetical protein
VCVNGARWVHKNVLAANPQAPLRVYAVWFESYEGDERELVDTRLLADPRVTQLWDGQQLAGRWYAHELTRPDDPEWVEWDAFFVYPPGDTWKDAGPRPLRWGRTILGKSEELREAVGALVN